MKPLISFIIPCYNLPGHLLRACINSIMALSLQEREREIIVVDDGSERSMTDVLSPYGKNIIYIRKENEGVSMARNTGMEQSSGAYIQFVDGDDEMISSLYNQCIDIIRGGHADMVLFDHVSHRKPSISFKVSSPTEGVDFMMYNNLRAAVWGYIFRRDLADDIKFSKGLAYGEDEEFTARLILQAKALYRTTAQAYFYRKREASVINDMSRQAVEKRLADGFCVVLRLQELASNLSVRPRKALNRRVAQLSMDYIYNTIRLTKSPKAVDHCVRQLGEKGLFPLPSEDYTRKYRWFRLATKTRTGRNLLCLTSKIIDL
ncbi:MAG: glycosyltransferase [Prevotella sp.]|nr:glycosyltransferase [Prevotella sp.]